MAIRTGTYADAHLCGTGLRGLRTATKTDPITSAVPIAVVHSSSSPSSAAPNAIATIGLTGGERRCRRRCPRRARGRAAGGRSRRRASPAVARSGSAGAVIRRDKRQGRRGRPQHRRAQHEHEAERGAAGPRAGERTMSASPTSPTTTVAWPRSGPRSPLARRQRIACSGPDPAIIAAILESMCVPATCTIPTPNVRSATPSSAEPASSRPLTRTLRPSAARSASRSTPAARKRPLAERSGGIVSTAILIARYVDRQTT